MSFKTNIENLAIRVATEFKALRVVLTGSGTGDASGLNTAASNLVDAVNEVKATADNASSGNLSQAQVEAIAQAEAQTLVDGLLDGAPAALDTLNELAASIGDSADFAGQITAQLSAKANTADVYTRTQLGDPQTNYVAIFETNLA